MAPENEGYLSLSLGRRKDGRDRDTRHLTSPSSRRHTCRAREVWAPRALVTTTRRTRRRKAGCSLFAALLPSTVGRFPVRTELSREAQGPARGAGSACSGRGRRQMCLRLSSSGAPFPAHEPRTHRERCPSPGGSDRALEGGWWTRMSSDASLSVSASQTG